MAERVSFIPEAEDESDDDFSWEGSGSKKKSKKSVEKIGAALIDKTEAPKTDNPLEKLRGLFAEKPEKTTEKANAEEILESTSNEALEATPLAEWRELNADELSGGEVVITLHDEISAEDDIPEETETSVVTPAEAIDTAEESEDAETKDEDTTPPLATGSGRGGNSGSGGAHGSSGTSGGGVPPRPPVPGGAYPPSPRRRPTSTMYRSATGAPAPPSGASFNQLLAAQQAADEAWSEGRGRGRREGLLAGLLVGGGIEHFRHKSREKKTEKQVKTERLKQEKKFEAEKSAFTRATTKERLEYEQKLHAEADAAIVAQTSEATATTKAIVAEKAKVDMEKEKAKLIERLNAQAVEQERLEAEALLKDPEHRIETSAWHAMEVDKSGHIAEDSTIEYGHEYYRERAHETGPKDQLDAKAGSAAVAAAILSGNSTRQQPVGDDTQSTGVKPFDSPFTQQSALPPITETDDQKDDDVSQAPATAIIPWLVVLSIIAIAIIFLT